MRVLLTRPADDARRTGEEIAARGHQSISAPLLEIAYCEDVRLDLADVQAILATSSNGVRAFSKASGRRDLALFAVGAQTASVATELGFGAIVNADGDAKALANTVSQRLAPEHGILLHAAGAETAGSFAADLAGRGFQVRTATLYSARAVRRLPAAASEALRSAALDAVLLFSPRSAAIFARCVAEEGLAEYCRPLVACCISDAAARPVGGLGFREIRIAARPDQTSMLALLP